MEVAFPDGPSGGREPPGLSLSVRGIGSPDAARGGPRGSAGGSAPASSYAEDSPIAQILIDATRRIRSANRAALRLLAWPETELRGRAFADLIAPVDRPTLDMLLSRMTPRGPGATQIRFDAHLGAASARPQVMTVFQLPFGSEGGFLVVLQDTGGRADPLRRDVRAPRSPLELRLRELV
jgi:PAS domain-containing protein